MTTRSLKQIGLWWKYLKFLPTHAPQPSAFGRDNLPSQRNSFSTEHRQALRQLEQTYTLERRWFL